MARLRMTLRLAVVIAMVFQVSAAPAPSPDPAPLDDDRPEIIEIIAPAEVAQETLDSLNLGEPNSEQGERNKRTIGILREMFPSLSKIIDRKIQQIVSFLFRTVGRSLLSGAIGGRGSSTSSTSSTSGSGQGGSKISISLPTYGPDGDDDDDSDEDDDSKTDQSSPSLRNRFAGDDDDSTTTESTADNEATSGVNAEENLLSEAESQQSEVRVQFAEPEGEKTVENKDDVASDQESAASGVNGAAIDDLSLDDADADASDENRNKRFLNFGFGDSSSSGSGSGGGSGNFLFDIIRLVAGSGGTEQTDEASGAPADGDVKSDTYTEGIPGPVTRLFIIANRGISNLIQDLILRLAQTSERIVNFKARLITSII